MIRKLGDLALWVGAVLGTVCLVAALAVVGFGLTPLVFRSGSMAPAIEAGDVAFARTVPVEKLAVGDVVSVRVGDDRVTHRVVKIHGSAIRMQGDANQTADPDPYRVDSAERVLFHLPKVGYLIGWASTPFGLFLSGLICAGLLYLVFRPSAGGRRRGDGDAVGRTLGRTTAAVLILAPVAIGVSTVPTQAYYADAATATPGSYRSKQIDFTSTCTDSLNKAAVLQWGSVAGASSYRVKATNPSTTYSVSGTSYTLPRSTAWRVVQVEAVFTGGGTRASAQSFKYRDEQGGGNSWAASICYQQ